jgi:hypothetical protein
MKLFSKKSSVLLLSVLQFTFVYIDTSITVVLYANRDAARWVLVGNFMISVIRNAEHSERYVQPTMLKSSTEKMCHTIDTRTLDVLI